MKSVLRIFLILLILSNYEQAFGTSSGCLLFDPSTEPPHRLDIVHKPTVVVEVDAFSTGTLFPDVIKSTYPSLGIVDVQSTAEIEYPKFKKQFEVIQDQFKENIPFNNNLDYIIKKLQTEYNVLFVIPGYEPGVLLANELSVRLGLINNGTQRSRAWRNKLLMQTVIKARGLESALTINSRKFSDILTWIHTENKGHWPVVLKPLASHGTNNVLFCNNEKEVRLAFNKIMSSKTQDGDENTSVVVQEYLAGDEFAVNIVGLGGNYYITEVWKYHKRKVNGAGAIYQYDEIVAYDDIPVELREYAFNVLKALEISNGPAHLEIKMVPDRGPVLVETAARFGGGKMPQGAKIATGTNQVELTAMAYLAPVDFKKNIGHAYTVYQSIFFVDLYSLAANKILKFADFEWIRKLPSFYPDSLVLFKKEGEVLPRTIDMSTSIGEVMLGHHDINQLHEDVVKIIDWEEKSFGR